MCEHNHTEATMKSSTTCILMGDHSSTTVKWPDTGGRGYIAHLNTVNIITIHDVSF